MRKDYDHLKPQQRRLLERGVEIIRQQFAESIKGKAWVRSKQGRILKIILYGSMARGKALRDAVGLWPFFPLTFCPVPAKGALA